jgi:ATP-dependent helicase/nuclease subunit B
MLGVISQLTGVAPPYLDELDADPGRAELGSIIHAALYEFLKLYPRALPAEAEAELLRIGRECFGPFLERPGVWAFWWPRFERIARWLLGEERVYRQGLAESFGECRGSLSLSSKGGPFTLVARADRIDRLARGGFVIVDYKTGTVPSPGEIDKGVTPQLPLEAAILREGGFGEFSGRPCALEYWRLSGGEPAGERRRIGGDDPEGLIEQALLRLRRLIGRFDDPATPYHAVPVARWAPRHSDYRHLERLEESRVER